MNFRHEKRTLTVGWCPQKICIFIIYFLARKYLHNLLLSPIYQVFYSSANTHYLFYMFLPNIQIYYYHHLKALISALADYL